MPIKYTEDMLREAVANSVSFAGAVRFLGLVEVGGNHVHISRRIRALGIDTSHFTGQAWSKGIKRPRKSPEQVLVRYPPGTPRVHGVRLRRALVALGRVYACASCGNGGLWMLRPIVLHVDHIDGDHRNCQPENLRFLCPNCHSQTATHAGRNKQRRRDLDQLEIALDHDRLVIGAEGGT